MEDYPVVVAIVGTLTGHFTTFRFVVGFTPNYLVLKNYAVFSTSMGKDVRYFHSKLRYHNVGTGKLCSIRLKVSKQNRTRSRYMSLARHKTM